MTARIQASSGGPALPLWRDLARMAADHRLPPAARHRAERGLACRLSEMTLGEKVTLAHIATRAVVKRMLEEPDAAVLRAAACNARTTEADLSRVLMRPDIPAPFLEWLAGESPWSERRALRLAIILHPQTPARASLRLLRGLAWQDLGELRSASAPRLVRVAAERALDRRDGSGSAPLDPVDTVSRRFLQSPADLRDFGERAAVARNGDR